MHAGPEDTVAARNPPRLPLVVFMLEQQRYALHLRAVERVLPMVAMSPLPQAPPIALGVLNLHGQVVPVLDMRRRLGRPPRDYGIAGHLLIARSSRRAVALPVDQVTGVAEVSAPDVIPPAAVLPGIGQIAGIVTLPDGLLFIHDLDTFLSLEEEHALDESLGAAGTP